MDKLFHFFERGFLLKGIILLISTLFLISCEDKTYENEDVLEAYGDIYIQQKKVNNEILYAPYYLLIANTSLNSANVETPDGENVELEPYEYLTTYVKEPDENEFSTSIMPSGYYHFKGTYGDGKTYDVSDIFEANIIDFPQIDSAKFDNTNFGINVYWKTLNRANIYKVKLLNQAGKVVFNGEELDDESVEYDINIDSEGWTTTPYTGDIFTLQLHAFLFDGDATDDNWYYNIECDSYIETQVVWGEN